jgi:Mg2+/Co2+ transporter CorB
MSQSDWILVAVMIGLLAFAAFLALAETSFTRMSRVKAMTLQEEGARGADTLAKLVERPEHVLNPVLLLVLICHLIIATLVGVLIERRFNGVLGFIAGIAFEVVAVFVLAEAAPKTYAVQHPDRSALRVAPVVSAIANFWPLRWHSRGLIGLSNAILPGKGLKEGPYVSEEELLAFMAFAREHWSKLRSTKPLERVSREIGRHIRPTSYLACRP